MPSPPGRSRPTAGTGAGLELALIRVSCSRTGAVGTGSGRFSFSSFGSSSSPSAAVDLLVVGTRGHGGFAGLMLGSVSQHVTAYAQCPVTVVR